MEAILVSNGPGELYTWVQPLVKQLRQHYPKWKVSICLIPCQFASGDEATIAKTFDADIVTNSSEFMRFLSMGQIPKGLGEKELASKSFVISLGGNTGFATKLANKLSYTCYCYSFDPSWHKDFKRLFVTDEKTTNKIKRTASHADVLSVGNLVADAVEDVNPITDIGQPHILIMFGSRPKLSRLIIPLMTAVAEQLAERYPKARFVAPLSRLLDEETVKDGILGKYKLIGTSSKREGDTIITPNGTEIELISEHDRYAHMRSATLAITIPGTNTLELGIATLPAIVVFPLNKPEVIPLEGLGHWLGLVPVVGKYLKRYAVLLAAPHIPILPNQITGEDLMVKIMGDISIEDIVEAATKLLNNDADRIRRKERLALLMPQAGAADAILASIMQDMQTS